MSGLAFDWTVTIDGTDVSAFIPAAGSISRGRQGTGVGFQSPRAVFDLFLPEANQKPSPGSLPTLAKWLPVIIHVTWDGSTQWRRFTGRIQALDYSRTTVRVTSAGNTVDFDGFPAGSTNAFAPRSVEYDTERVEWLCDGAPWPVTIEGAPARRLRQIERNTEASPLLDQILRIADDCDGVFLEDPLGVPHYRSRSFTLPARYTIPHGIVDGDNLTLSTDAGDVVTTVRVSYGEPDDETGLQKHKTATNSTLAATIGYDVPAEITTDLRSPEGAQGKANQYLSQHADLHQLPDVPLVMSLATGSEADDILDLQEGWPVTVETLPDGWPVEDIDADIIGITEIMHQSDYRIILHLGPPRELADEDDGDPIYPDGILEGYDATGTEEIDDKVLRWCRWDASGFVTNTYTIAALYVQLVAAAKGGHPGEGTGIWGHGGNSGAGGFINEHIDLNPGTWPILVGDDSNDGDTRVYGTRLYKGGDGGDAFGDEDGQDGASGGTPWYNRADNTPHGEYGKGIVGQGHDASGLTGGGASDVDGYSGIDVEIGGETVTFCAGGNDSREDGPGAGGIGSSTLGGIVDGTAGRVYLRYRIG